MRTNFLGWDANKSTRAVARLCVYLTSICLTNNCAVKPQRSTKAALPPPPVSPTLPSPQPQLSYFLVTDKRPPVAAENLRIYRPQVSRLALGQSFLPLLSFAADGEADYVSWQACSYQGSGRCLGGQSMETAVLLGSLAPDNYTISLQACTYPERALTKDKNCGPLSSVPWHQPALAGREQEAKVQELSAKNLEIHAVGNKLYEQLSIFAQEVKACKKADRLKKKKTDSQENPQTPELLDVTAFDTLVANLLELGPEFSASTLSGTRLGESDAALAAILEPALMEENPNQAYKPDSLLLTTPREASSSTRTIDWGALAVFYASTRPQQLVNNGSVSSRDILPAIIGASGLSLSGLGLHTADTPYRRFSPAEFAALSPQAKASVFAGLLALHAQGLQLSASSPFAGDFAGAEFLRAALHLKKPAGSCEAYTRLELAVTRLREQAESLKERILQLKAELNAQP